MVEAWCKIVLLLLLIHGKTLGQSTWIAKKKETPAGYKWGFYNSKGKTQLEPVYDTVYFDFLNGYAAVGQRVNDSLFAGLINKKGKVVLDYSYHDIKVLENYFSLESPEHMLGLADADLNIVLSPGYKSIAISDSGIYSVQFPLYDIYTSKGFLIRSVSADSVSILNGYLTAYRNGFDLPLFKSPAIVVEAEINESQIPLDTVLQLENPAVIVKEGEYYGFADTSGKVLISIQYEDARPFAFGLAPVKILGKWAYINLKEEFVIQPIFEDAWPFYGASALVKIDNTFNFIDQKGTLQNERGFTKVERLPTGNWQIWSGNSGQNVGLADSLGREMIIPKYTLLDDWGNGYACFLKHGLYGVLDYDQNILVPGKYSYVYRLNEYLIGKLFDAKTIFKPVAKK